MAIITISRELAALGDETAHELAKLLDYRFIDKHTLEERIKSFGITEKKFEKFDERKPSFWASLSQDRDDYLHYLKAAVFEEAATGNCVFIGRGAHVIFKNLPSLLSIKLVAPKEIRYERVKSYFHCDEKRARQIIEQSDHDRDGFHKYFFDVDWTEAEYYHLVLNTGYLHPSTAASIIQDLKEQVISKETENLSRVNLKELALAQKIVHHVLYENKIPIHFLDAIVSNGAVVLHGVSNSQGSVEAAVSAAKEIPDVNSVQSEIQVVQEYSVMP